MILDELANAQTYSPLHPGFAPAFAFLSNPGIEDLPVGRYEIDGDRIYAMVQRGPGRAREEAFLETHDRYIDIQLVLDGTDQMGWKPRSRCVEVQREYDAATDIAFYRDIPTAWIAVEQGMFAVFFPEDAHLPSISPEEIHKVVVKIRLA
jgi:YhcH/YjgK/YiaL family protein